MKVKATAGTFSPPGTRRPSRPGRQAGFTLVEAVMALAVFSIVGLAVGGATVTAVRALTAAHTDMLFTSTLGLTEHELRARTACVRFPFWLAAMPEIETDGRLTLPYADGNKDMSLEVTFEDSLLTVGLASETEGEDLPRRVFSGFGEAGWEYLKNDKDEPIGLSFTLKPAAHPERTIVINARFGGLPLGEAGE